MKYLRKLHLVVHNVEIISSVAMLLRALEHNISIWQVTTNLEEDLSEVERNTMELYAARNKHIHAIMEAPRDSVQLLSVLPRVIRAVQGYRMGASITFAALTALDERHSGRTRDRESSVAGSPKRKRESRDEVSLLGPRDVGCTPPVV
jgi:hypothetical protein